MNDASGRVVDREIGGHRDVDSCRACEARPIKRVAEQSAGQVPKRNRVWAKSPLAKDSTLLGWTLKTWATPASWQKAPSRTSYCQSPSYFVFHIVASARSNVSSVTRSARPSTTMSRPAFQRLSPVVSAHWSLALRLTAFCSPGPVQK